MKKPISEKISELRKARRLTQEQLGAELGVSGQAVSKWESGASMPDLLLIPELCHVLGTTANELLETPSARQKNTVDDFCAYARETGRSRAVVDVIARLFNSVGNYNKGQNILCSSPEIRVSDERGMGFVLVGEEYQRACREMKNEDIAYFLRILTDEACLSVIKLISADCAVTEKEIMEALNMDEPTADRVLLGLMKRNIICVDTDKTGKRGYLATVGIVGVWMVLSGCLAINCGGEGLGSVWFARN